LSLVGHKAKSGDLRGGSQRTPPEPRDHPCGIIPAGNPGPEGHQEGTPGKAKQGTVNQLSDLHAWKTSRARKAGTQLQVQGSRDGTLNRVVMLGQSLDWTEENDTRGFPQALNQVFTRTQTCDLRRVKAATLGQDPRRGPHQAHGFCFNPRSLGNTYKELSADTTVLFILVTEVYLDGPARCSPAHCCPHRPAHQASSHTGWEHLTGTVASWLNPTARGLVSGAPMFRRKAVPQTAHPSPRPVHRGLLGCRHFSKITALLPKASEGPVNWKDL
uniref:Uncharacterized protein n=1 Tax=Phocoena sinus TaxID=42100 RepID=A0A8C9B9J6_PHOSS